LVLGRRIVNGRPCTPRAQAALDRAVAAAKAFGDRQVGPDHVLLGLLGDQETTGWQVLNAFEGGVQQLAEEVGNQLNQNPARQAIQATPDPHAEGPEPREAIRTLNKALQEPTPAQEDRSLIEPCGTPPLQIPLDRLIAPMPLRRVVPITLALLAGVVLVAADCGVGIPWSLLVWRVTTEICLLGTCLAMFLLLLSLVRCHKLGRTVWHVLVHAATLAYALGLVLWDPFFLLGRHHAIVAAALILAPFLLAVGFFVRARYWVGIMGGTLFVFVATLMTAWNAKHGYAAIWFHLPRLM
jgi:hypothetical protein